MKKLKELRAKLDEVSTGYLNRYIGLSKDKKGNIQKTGAAGSLEKSLKKSADAFRSGDKEARRAATKTANKRAKGLQMARAKLDKKVGAGSRAKVPATEAVKYPHMMYDPKTGKEVTAKTPADHNKYTKMGYTHEKPTNEAVQYKVDVEGLPPTFMTGKSPAEILSKLRKIVKQPSMIKSVERHTDMEVRKAYRNKAQGREMDEAVTYHGNPNKDDDARNAARRKRLAKQDNKVKLKGFGPDAAKGNMGNPVARASLRTEASVVPSKDGKKLVPMKKHSAPKSEPVSNDQFGLPRLKKTNEVSMPVKQRAADERARRQNQADDELSKAEKHPLSNIPFTKAKKKADNAGKKFNRNYIGTNPEMGDGGKRAALYKKAGVVRPSVKLKSGDSTNEATYGTQAQRMMSPLQKARQDKEKADRDRHGKLNMMKGRPKKLGEISQDLKQRYTDKAKSDYGHQQFSADIAREMGHKDAEKYYRRKQRNRMAGITKAKK